MEQENNGLSQKEARSLKRVILGDFKSRTEISESELIKAIINSGIVSNKNDAKAKISEMEQVIYSYVGIFNNKLEILHHNEMYNVSIFYSQVNYTSR